MEEEFESHPLSLVRKPHPQVVLANNTLAVYTEGVVPRPASKPAHPLGPGGTSKSVWGAQTPKLNPSSWKSETYNWPVALQVFQPLKKTTKRREAMTPEKNADMTSQQVLLLKR